MQKEKYQHLLTQALEAIGGIIIVDTDERIVFISKKYATEALSLNPDNLVGKKIKEVVPNSRLPIALHSGLKEIGTLFKTKNGCNAVFNHKPINKNGKNIGAISFATFMKMEELDNHKEDSEILQRAKYSLEQIIGDSVDIIRLKKNITKIAQTKSTVLITGETGTGKELVAHAIHQQSPRSHNNFICLNCAAILPSLGEYELFGYEEGAFTGAKKGGKPGKFELANGGTLLLDDIDQLTFELQSRLLRVLQEKEIERVGGNKLINIDVRIICTTNQDLLELVKQKRFREDLYYRLNVINVTIPPLRERLDDLPQLVDFCLTRINHNLCLNVEGVTTEVMNLLKSYHWPGNIRELENALESSAALALSDFLEVHHFKDLENRLPIGSFSHAKERIYDLNRCKKKAGKMADI